MRNMLSILFLIFQRISEGCRRQVNVDKTTWTKDQKCLGMSFFKQIINGILGLSDPCDAYHPDMFAEVPSFKFKDTDAIRSDYIG